MRDFYRTFLLCGVSVTATMLPVYGQASFDVPQEEEVVELTEEEIRKKEISEKIETIRDQIFDDPQNPDLRWLLAKQYLLLDIGDIAENELNRAVELGIEKPALYVDLGKAYLLKNKYQDIIENIFIEDANDEDKDQVNLILGHAYFGLKNYEIAFSHYLTAQESLPQSAELNRPLAKLYEMQGDYEQSENLIDVALKLDGKDVTSLILKGDLVHRKEGAQRSYKYYEQAVFFEPDNIDAQTKISGTLYNLQMDEDALEHLSRVLRKNSRHALANFMAASISARQDNLRRALRYLDAASDGLNEFPPALLLKGKIHYKRGNYDQAITTFSKLLFIENNNTEAKRFLAASYLHDKNARRAVSILEELVDEGKSDKSDILLLSMAYFSMNDHEKSSFYMKLASGVDSSNLSYDDKEKIVQFSNAESEGTSLKVEPLLNEGQGDYLRIYRYLDDGKYDLALEQASILIRQNSRNPIGYDLLGQAFQGMRKYEEAASNYNKAINIDRRFHQARLNFAKMELSLGRNNEAIKQLNNILNIDDGYIPAYELLSTISYNTGDVFRAERYLTTALRIKPGNLPLRLKLANYYILQNNLSNAQIQGNRLIADVPEYYGGYKILGNVEILQKNYSSAIDHLEKSLSLNKKDSEIYILLSTSYNENDQKENTKMILEKGMRSVTDKLPLIKQIITYALEHDDFQTGYNYVEQLKLDQHTRAYAFYKEGELNLAEGRNADARQSFQKAGKAGADENLIMARLIDTGPAEQAQEEVESEEENLLPSSREEALQSSEELIDVSE